MNHTRKRVSFRMSCMTRGGDGGDFSYTDEHLQRLSAIMMCTIPVFLIDGVISHMPTRYVIIPP